MADVRFIRFLKEKNAPTLLKGQKLSKAEALQANLTAAKERQSNLFTKVQRLVQTGKEQKVRTETREQQVQWTAEYQRLQAACDATSREAREYLSQLTSRCTDRETQATCVQLAEESEQASADRARLQHTQLAAAAELRRAARHYATALRPHSSFPNGSAPPYKSRPHGAGRPHGLAAAGCARAAPRPSGGGCHAARGTGPPPGPNVVSAGGAAVAGLDREAANLLETLRTMRSEAEEEARCLGDQARAAAAGELDAVARSLPRLLLGSPRSPSRNSLTHSMPTGHPRPLHPHPHPRYPGPQQARYRSDRSM